MKENAVDQLAIPTIAEGESLEDSRSNVEEFDADAAGARETLRRAVPGRAASPGSVLSTAGGAGSSTMAPSRMSTGVSGASMGTKGILDAVEWLLAAPPLLGLGLVMGFSPTLYGFRCSCAGRGRAGAVRWMSMGLLVASTLLVVIFQFVDPENLMKVLKGRIDAFLLTRWVDPGPPCCSACGAVLLVATAMTAPDRPRSTGRLRGPPGRRAFPGSASPTP